MPTIWRAAGENMVRSLWDGMKSLWASFVGWLADSINNSPIGKFMEFVGIGKFVGSSGISSAVSNAQNAGPTRAGAGLAQMAPNAANPFAAAAGYAQPPQQQKQGGGGPMQVNLIVDGETVFGKMFQMMENKEGRH